MKIHLNEIPEDGRAYTFNRNTAELNNSLKDILADRAYQINLYIKPLNTRDYELNGSVSAETHEQCSKCGEEFQFAVNAKLREYLIPSQSADRTDKYAKTNVQVSSEEGEISVLEYSNLQLDLGEYVHEAIALEVPFNPVCNECHKNSNTEPLIYDEKMGEDEKKNPFKALKGLKLN